MQPIPKGNCGMKTKPEQPKSLSPMSENLGAQINVPRADIPTDIMKLFNPIPPPGSSFTIGIDRTSPYQPWIRMDETPRIDIDFGNGESIVWDDSNPKSFSLRKSIPEHPSADQAPRTKFALIADHTYKATPLRPGVKPFPSRLLVKSDNIKDDDFNAIAELTPDAGKIRFFAARLPMAMFFAGRTNNNQRDVINQIAKHCAQGAKLFDLKPLVVTIDVDGQEIETATPTARKMLKRCGPTKSYGPTVRDMINLEPNGLNGAGKAALHEVYETLEIASTKMNERIGNEINVPWKKIPASIQKIFPVRWSGPKFVKLGIDSSHPYQAWMCRCNADGKAGKKILVNLDEADKSTPNAAEKELFAEHLPVATYYAGLTNRNRRLTVNKLATLCAPKGERFFTLKSLIDDTKAATPAAQEFLDNKKNIPVAKDLIELDSNGLTLAEKSALLAHLPKTNSTLGRNSKKRKVDQLVDDSLSEDSDLEIESASNPKKRKGEQGVLATTEVVREIGEFALESGDSSSSTDAVIPMLSTEAASSRGETLLFNSESDFFPATSVAANSPRQGEQFDELLLDLQLAMDVNSSISLDLLGNSTLPENSPVVLPFTFDGPIDIDGPVFGEAIKQNSQVFGEDTYVNPTNIALICSFAQEAAEAAHTDQPFENYLILRNLIANNTQEVGDFLNTTPADTDVEKRTHTYLRKLVDLIPQAVDFNQIVADEQRVLSNALASYRDIPSTELAIPNPTFDNMFEEYVTFNSIDNNMVADIDANSNQFYEISSDMTATEHNAMPPQDVRQYTEKTSDKFNINDCIDPKLTPVLPPAPSPSALLQPASPLSAIDQSTPQNLPNISPALLEKARGQNPGDQTPKRITRSSKTRV